MPNKIPIFRNKLSGFTLIELLIVIGIIAVLAAAGLAIYTKVSQNARDARRQSDLRSIQSALEQYNSDQFFYPNTPGNTFPWGAAFTNSTGNPDAATLPKTYLNSVPTDPTVGTTTPYYYVAQPGICNNTATKCTSYCLYANMENSSNGNKGTVSAPSGCPFVVFLTNYNFAVTLP